MCEFLHNLFVTQAMRDQWQTVRSQRLTYVAHVIFHCVFFIKGYSQLRAVVGAMGLTSSID